MMEAQMEADQEAAALELDLLTEAIYRAYHYDFRGYNRASLARRVAKAAADLASPTLLQLLERVLADPACFAALLPYLTVQVSDLFRDPDYFRALRERVVPHLSTYPFIRVWVAGCATGEEAYSIAIVLREEGLLERSRIYATDIDAESLRIAERGIYGLERVRAFSESYFAAGGRGSLSDYYTTAYGHAALDPALRQQIVFSDHSLATDAVFAEVQLVSCRNVLIYFDRTLQDRALGLFRDALCPRGFLGLGARETVAFSGHAQAFEPFAERERIFRRR
jgi:chemotaxis protein methyltransferase CheR